MATEPLSTSTHLRDLKALLSPIKANNIVLYMYCGIDFIGQRKRKPLRQLYHTMALKL